MENQSNGFDPYRRIAVALSCGSQSAVLASRQTLGDVARCTCACVCVRDAATAFLILLFSHEAAKPDERPVQSAWRKLLALTLSGITVFCAYYRIAHVAASSSAILAVKSISSGIVRRTRAGRTPEIRSYSVIDWKPPGPGARDKRSRGELL